MRTFVTLDSDVEAILRRLMRERGVSFTEALNDAVRDGAEPGSNQTRVYTQPRHLGELRSVAESVMKFAGEMENIQIVKKMRRDK